MKIKLSAIFFAGVLFFFTLLGESHAEPLPLPISLQDSEWHPLYDSVNAQLQGKLAAALNKNLSWRNLIRKEKMAVGVVDLSDIQNPRFARVNGEKMMYAASLPKIAILLAACVSFEDGSLIETPEIHQDLVDMIRISNNAAATRMIDRIGMEKIQSVLISPQYQFYDKEKGGGLWVGKRYAKLGKRLPDPLAGLSHGATVTQTCRFYYLLATGRIINMERSRQMLEILSAPGVYHKFVKELRELVPLDRVFRKSGTWSVYHSDSVLVWGEVWRRYILVAMVESVDGEQVLRNLVPVVEEILKPDGGPSSKPRLLPFSPK